MESPLSHRKRKSSRKGALVKPLGAFSALVMGVTLAALPTSAHADETDTKAPTVTVKEGDSFTVKANGDYEKVSFTLFDAGKIDKVVLNGVVKDLANNAWSDLNYVKPGVSGAVLGENTLEVFDVAGNVTTVNFVLNPKAPTVTVKEGDSYTARDGETYEKVSFKLFDAGRVDKVVLNGEVKDLSNNTWSDLNFVTPGVFGAVLGENTLEAFDVAGNKTTLTFTLSATGPTVTVKTGDAYTVAAGDTYEKVSFKLFDAGKVDKVVLNGVVKDLSNNTWSDLNFVTPGVSGAVHGENTLKAHDISGNVTTVNFVLNPKAPTVTIKDSAAYTVEDEGYEKISFKLFDAGKVDKVVLNGVVKDLSNNTWSDLNFVAPGVFGAVLGENTLEVLDVAGNITTLNFTLVEPRVASDTPVIGSSHPRGYVTQGARLTADEGTWSPAPAFAYQWFRDGAPIEGETGPTLHLSGERYLPGTVITVQVTGSHEGHRSAVVSTSVPVVNSRGEI